MRRIMQRIVLVMFQGNLIGIGALTAAVDVMANQTVGEGGVGVGIDVAVLTAAVEGASDTASCAVSRPTAL